jgi:hypothetical protein
MGVVKMRTDRFTEKTQEALQAAASLAAAEGDTIEVDVADGDLVFRRVAAAEPEPEPARV